MTTTRPRPTATHGGRRARRAGPRGAGGSGGSAPRGAPGARPGPRQQPQAVQLGQAAARGQEEAPVESPPCAGGRATSADSGLPELISTRIRDIPDYPQPGIVFKDITPLLADGAAFGRGRRRAGRRSTAGSTRWSGSRRAGSSSPRRWPAACRRVSSRSASRASCPAATYAESYQLEYGTATIEVHTDAFEPASGCSSWTTCSPPAGPRPPRPAWSAASGAEVAAIAVLLELGFLNGRARLPALRSARCSRCDGPQAAGHVMNRPSIDCILRRT